MTSLPEELVAKIFETLPVKSLVQFRCLSKSWCSHISSPDFIRDYTLRFLKSPQKVLIINQVYNYESSDVYKLLMGDQRVTAVEFPGGDFRVVGSCNGLVCLLDNDQRFTLWNFAIRRKLTLPTHPLVQNLFNNSRVIVGFGFDPVSQDYKIVANSFIYSVKMGSWSEIASPATAFYDLEIPSCSVNGAVNWVLTSYLPESPTHPFILTFNLSNHGFGMFSLPEPSWEPEQLTVVNGALAVVCSKGNDTWIWVRKQSNDVASWSVVSKVDNIQFALLRVLQPTPNGDILFFRYSDGSLDVYNPETKVFTEFVELKDNDYVESDMETYAESLELLDIGTTCVVIDPKR